MRMGVGLTGLVSALAVSALVWGTHAGAPGAKAMDQRTPARVIVAGQTFQPRAAPPELPFGGTTIWPGRTLVAYYGTAGTGALGVLGEGSIASMTRRLREQAARYDRPDRPAQIVYELIVTVVDATPGKDGDYSHDISRDHVRQFIAAAHRNKALLVLDIQPGRSDFLTVAKRWAWALKDPWVSLALDPEWRMGPHQVPAQTIGQVSAYEINLTSAWLETLVRENNLPEKILMVHQFRSDMVRNIDNVRDRPHLAEVQHVDGFGTRGQKLETYAAVEQHDQFRMGFKLFYDEDTHLFRPADVLRIRPAVRFVSYQ